MVNYSNEENINRKKVNYVNYKDLCEKLKLPVYKRGSEEKKKQLEELEKTMNIHKNKDNSFTQINEEFKRKKEKKETQYRLDNTITVGDYSLYLGKGKYKFKEFNNMRNLFLNFIRDSKANTKKTYVYDFFKDCYLFELIQDKEFKESLGMKKATHMAWEVFYEECKYAYNQFLKECKWFIYDYVTYFDSDNQEVDSLKCEMAEAQAKDELKFTYTDYKKRSSDYYDKINEILINDGENAVTRREIKFLLRTGMSEIIVDVDEKQYDYNMEKLIEIIKYVVILKLKKKERRAGVGIIRVKNYELTTDEFNEAKEFIEKYVCYLKTDFSENRKEAI